MTTYQVPRSTDTFVERLDALPNLKVRPAGIVQPVHARLFPEDTGHVEDVAPEYDIAAQSEQLPSEPHRVTPRERQRAGARKRAWQGLRARMLKDCICLRFVVC